MGSDNSAAWVRHEEESRFIEVPCQNCGKPVRVYAPSGVWRGCAFCRDCLDTTGTYIYREAW